MFSRVGPVHYELGPSPHGASGALGAAYNLEGVNHIVQYDIFVDKMYSAR